MSMPPLRLVVLGNLDHKQQGETIHTFSIVTTRANELVANIHNAAYPFIRQPNAFVYCLRKMNRYGYQLAMVTSAQALACSYPSQAMQHHTVSHLITSRKENTKCGSCANARYQP